MWALISNLSFSFYFTKQKAFTNNNMTWKGMENVLCLLSPLKFIFKRGTDYKFSFSFYFVKHKGIFFDASFNLRMRRKKKLESLLHDLLKKAKTRLKNSAASEWEYCSLKHCFYIFFPFPLKSLKLAIGSIKVFS